MASTSIALATVQAVIARAIADGKHDRGRIERAAALVAFGAVGKTDERTYRVDSQTDRDVAYIVTPDGCDCPDAQRNPGRRCKHDLAVRIILSAEIDERRAAEQAARARFSADAVALAYARAFGRAA